MTYGLSIWRGIVRRHPMKVCNENRVRAMPDRARLIVEEVATKYELHPSDLLGVARTRCISRPRFEAMARIRDEITINGAPPSLPQIGSWFGGRDHSTVINALRRHAELSAEAA